MYKYRNRIHFYARLAFAFITLISLTACQSMYYGAMEKVGYEKREILVDRVDSARESQQDAKKQFESALEQFVAVTNYSGGELDKQYKSLKSAYEDSKSRAQEVHERIGSVEHVARALFNEWQAEIAQYSSKDLKHTSEQQLQNTKYSYKTLITSMKRAEKKIEPVLTAFHDRVLFLKHNLNASAITSLKTQKKSVEADIKSLIADMNKSISEADSFIRKMSN